MKKITILAITLLISATSAFAHSDAFQPKFVDTLVNPYLAIQKGLAGDDLKAAQVGANNFLEAMKNAPNEGEAKEEAADLSTPAKTISEASDIKAARMAFLELSREVIPLVKHVGVTKGINLFTVHCPMAFGHQGGDWIQSDKTVANPYLGSKMLRCGSIQKQIAGNTDASHGHSDHDDEHEHSGDHH